MRNSHLSTDEKALEKNTHDELRNILSSERDSFRFICRAQLHLKSFKAPLHPLYHADQNRCSERRHIIRLGNRESERISKLFAFFVYPS